MRRPALQMLILLGIMLPVLLMVANAPTAAQSLTGVTPTIEVAAGTPVPVGGQLALVDRGAVLQAALGPLVMPLAALVIIVGIAGFAVTRHWSAN